MHWRRAGLVIAPALLALGCSPPEETTAQTEAVEAPLAETSPDAGASNVEMGQGEPVPEKLLGTWVYSHEECEPDSEMTPDTREIRASINFGADRTFGMSVEGFDSAGTYRYAGGEYPRITLDNMLNFAVEGDTLQNWSEGDAVYQCGRVFVREK